MSRRFGLAVIALVLGGCAVGPNYHAAPVVPPTARVGMAPLPDSTRAFFDSLATARAADTTQAALVRVPAPRALAAPALADLKWLDVLHDSLLVDLVNRALARNRNLGAARARIAEYRANVGAARSALFPGLAVNGSVSRAQSVFGSQTIPAYSAWRATADLSWELDFWGLARRGLEAVNADLASQQAAERATTLTLVSDVATGYLSLLELDQEAAIAAQTLASRQSTLDLARQRLAQGVISELDVRQFEAQVAVPAARLAQVEQLRAQEEHALNTLVGEGPVSVRRGVSLAQAAGAVTVPDSVPSSLVDRRPDVEAAERAYAAATARAGVAAAARLPSVSIGASYGTQATTPGDMFSSKDEVYQVVAGISIPIFTGGRLGSQERAARARAEEARAAYEEVTLTALEEVGDALAGVRSARDQLTAQETQATALRQALDLAEVRYQGGVSNYLEVLDAERGLFTAQLAESEAELQELDAAVELYKALGGSWPESH